jgi:formate dehydrogenase major subunit
MSQLSRRLFLKASAAGLAPATALGSLAGLGATLVPATARAQQLRIKEAKATPSVCPYCSVGCAMIVHTIGNDIVNIEGDKRSPHNEGCLCPKGAATYQLLKNPNRATRVLHRKPGRTKWEEVELDWAMDRIAQLVRKTRDETFIERLDDGTLVNQTTSIFSLGGATLDNEWNHMQQKLMRGLGAVAIENQARI